MSKPEASDGGPGFRRMKARLGPERMEAMRIQVLREQEKALAEALAAPRPAAPQERTTYTDYPAPQGAGGGRQSAARRARKNRKL